MPVDELIVFDCGTPGDPVPIASFRIHDVDYDGRLRYLQTLGVMREFFYLHPKYVASHDDEIRIPQHTDGTFFLSDSIPSAWGARLTGRLLKQAGKSLPKNAFEWLKQPAHCGPGRLVFSNDRDNAPELDGITASPRDLTPELSAELYNFIDLPDAYLDANALRILRPGGDLGGVRPKTVVTHEGREHIAKFGVPTDRFDMPMAEYATLRLAFQSGISVPSFELIEVGSRTALLVERFDRTDCGKRIHYLSAYSLLNPRPSEGDREQYRDAFSYAGLAEALYAFSDYAPELGRELFRRMVLNIMVGNTDDHLRNHGVLMEKPGKFELSPAFDICPHLEAPFRSQSIGVGDLGAASTVENALSQSARFLLSPSEAGKIISEVKDVVSQWRRVFAEAGATTTDLQRLRPCFSVAEQADVVSVNLRPE